MLGVHVAERHVHRLLRRDDAKLAEARDVGRGSGLDVLEPMSAAAGRRGVGGRGPLEGVERHADSAVANGVDEDLPSALVHHGHEAVQLVGRQVGSAG